MNNPVGSRSQIGPLAKVSCQRSRLRNGLFQLGVCLAFFKQFLKMRMAYRVDFLIDLAANLFAMAVQLSVLTVVFSKITALQSWTFEQVLFIYGFSLLPLGLFNIVSINLYIISSLNELKRITI